MQRKKHSRRIISWNKMPLLRIECHMPSMRHPGLLLRWWPEFMLRPLWNAHCRQSSMRNIFRWLRNSCDWWHSSHCRFHETQPQGHGNLWSSWKQTPSILFQHNQKIKPLFLSRLKLKNHGLTWNLGVSKLLHHIPLKWMVKPIVTIIINQFLQTLTPSKTTHPKEGRNLEKKHLCKNANASWGRAVNMAWGCCVVPFGLFLHPIHQFSFCSYFLLALMTVNEGSLEVVMNFGKILSFYPPITSQYSRLTGEVMLVAYLTAKRLPFHPKKNKKRTSYLLPFPPFHPQQKQQEKTEKKWRCSQGTWEAFEIAMIPKFQILSVLSHLSHLGSWVHHLPEAAMIHLLFKKNPSRRKFRSLTSENMDSWKSRAE